MSPIGSTHSPVVPIAAPFDLTDYPELAGISGISGTGLVTRIGLGSYATRTITGTTNQVNVANGSGVVGNPTLSLPQNIHTAATPTFAGITLSGMTAGSVLFASTGGVVSQDNSNLYWDDSNNRLGIRTTVPSTLLHINIGNTSGSPDEGLRLEVTGNSGVARGPKIVFYGPAGAGTSSNNGELHSTNGYMNLVNGSGASLLYINKATAYAAQVGGGTALDWLGLTRVLQVKNSTALVDYNDNSTNKQSSLYSNWYRHNAATTNIIADGYYGHLTFDYYNGIWGLFNSASSGVAGGSATPVERLRVTVAGNLLIGTTTETASSGLIQLATGTTAASGILWGTDTNLYRDAANSLKTDDSLSVPNGLFTGYNFTIGNAGGGYWGITNSALGRVDANYAVQQNAAGFTVIGAPSGQIVRVAVAAAAKLEIAGSLTTSSNPIDITAAAGLTFSTDTNLYRSAANTLKTDDALTIADTTASTSSTTGALIVSGGIGVAKDSYINSIRVGLGANSVATNTALGVSALAAITTGARNVAAGYLSATSQASQSDTVAIGNEAARYLTNYGNVAIGSYAVTGTNGSATGTENVGIGYAALNVITSGYRNVAIGAYAGNKITGGISNMLIGELAGYSITTGLANCYIGSQAGAYMTGSNNTGIGYSSMFGVLGSSTGVGNTGIGYYTGIALTTGSRNTIIGYNTGIGLTSGSNNIILGANAGKYSTTQSNELIIDNQDRTNRAGDIAGALLYGTFNATPSSQTLTVNAALKPTNSATSQIVVSGWDSVGGASAQNGSIDFGTLSTAKGVIHYESSSVGKLYLDNTYDNTAGEIRLRLRTAGTAVDMATFNVAGTTFKVPTGGYIYNRVNTTDITEVSSGGLKVGSGTLTVLGGASFITTSTALTNGAGAGAGTLTNAPSAGDPTKWIGINDNGTTRYIPAW